MSENEKQVIRTIVYSVQTAQAVDKIEQYSNDKKLKLAIANFRHHHEKYTLGQLSYSDYVVVAISVILPKNCTTKIRKKSYL